MSERKKASKLPWAAPASKQPDDQNSDATQENTSSPSDARHSPPSNWSWLNLPILGVLSVSLWINQSGNDADYLALAISVVATTIGVFAALQLNEKKDQKDKLIIKAKGSGLAFCL